MVVLAVVIGVAVLVGVVALVVGLRLQKRWYAGTGLDQWRATRRSLSWRDWLSVVVPQMLGRPVTDRRLATVAHQRGDFARAATARTLAPGSPLRRLRWLLVGVWSLQALLALLPVVEGEPVDTVQLVLALLNLVLWLGFLRLQASGLRMIERSLAGTPARPGGKSQR